MTETLYLLSSPANAMRLFESIEQVRRGEVEEHELVTLDIQQSYD
jgi:PHD/YefM family antitoxin component YafN of YafNO toxin-antitoxin module